MNKIALLGPKGTFTDVAYIEYKNMYDDILSNYKVIYCKSIDDVVFDVNKEAIIGIVPIENTLDGYVQRTLDLLLEEDMFIIDEITVPVNFNLIANCNSIEEIKNVYVQFKAAGQCRKILKELTDAMVTTTNSNMESFYKLDSNIYTDAAIVPMHIKDDSKLNILNVADSQNNYTRFLVITKKDRLESQYSEFLNKLNKNGDYNKVRFNVCILPEHDRPGLLFDILRSINDNMINMVSIMSRPTKTDLGTYNFFIEMESSIKDEEIILNTLKDIKKHNSYYVDIKVLGKYYLKKI